MAIDLQLPQASVEAMEDEPDEYVERHLRREDLLEFLELRPEELAKWLGVDEEPPDPA